MGNLVDFLEGAAILKTYKDPAEDKDENAISAQHDAIFCFSTSPDELSDEDKTKVENLGGWHWNDEYDCWEFMT